MPPRAAADGLTRLLVPGLFGPVPAMLLDEDLPRLPAVELLARRATVEPGQPTRTEELCALFGLVRQPGGDVPTAAVCYTAEGGQAGDAWVLHADPVVLRPDRDQLLVFGGDDLALDDEESVECVDAFNAHFGDDGVRLARSPAGRWYLLADADPQVVTTPLERVLGRPLGGELPQGPRRAYWQGLLNETQMLFFQLGVNQRREALGQPTLGGVWLSGAGRAPRRLVSPFAQVEGGDPLVAACTALADVQGSERLVVVDTAWQALLAGDAGRWLDAVRGIDGRIGALASSGDLVLHPCNGRRYRVTKGRDWRFWRRRPRFVDLAR